MASRCNVDPAKLHSTLKNTVFKGATDDELLALVVTANTYELNPLLKELYAFPKKGGGISPMVGFDGWMKIINRQPNFDGLEVEVYGEGKTPTHATCEIFFKDRSRSVKITEYFEECRRNTDPWNQMPRRMIRNKAVMQAGRVAFGIGGIHDEDEAADIGMRNATPQRTEQSDPLEQALSESPRLLSETAKIRRASRPAPQVIEAAAEPEAPLVAEAVEAPAVEDRGLLVFYEKLDVKNGTTKDNKPFKKYTLHYTIPGGPCREADTFSSSLVEPVENADEGVMIRIEVTENTNPKFSDTLTFLEIAEEVPATPTKEAW